MKIFGLIALLITSTILISCESREDSIVTSIYSTKDSDNPSNLRFDVGIDLIDLDDIIITKTIDGSAGGALNIDTILIDPNGNIVLVQADLIFEPNSFPGTQNITMSPDLSTGSIHFSPSMILARPAELTLKFRGINLSQLGFDANAKVDFVFIANDGTIENIEYEECKIKWAEQELKVKKAKLPHFSRYAFIKKN
jgi:hypothetical protein